MREVLQNWWFMLGNVMESVFLRFTTTLVSIQCVFFWIVASGKVCQKYGTAQEVQKYRRKF